MCVVFWRCVGIKYCTGAAEISIIRGSSKVIQHRKTFFLVFGDATSQYVLAMLQEMRTHQEDSISCAQNTHIFRKISAQHNDSRLSEIKWMIFLNGLFGSPSNLFYSATQMTK